MPRPTTARAVVFACCACALLLTGIHCSEEKISCPTLCAGRIEGRILGGMGPVRATVEAQSPSGVEPEVHVEMDCDAEGYYALPVPPGKYFLYIRERSSWVDLYYSSDGMRSHRADAETLSVGGRPVRVDCVGGALTVHLQAPPNLEGEGIQCEVEGWSDHGVSARVEAPVLGGAAEFTFPFLPAGSFVATLDLPHTTLWLPDGPSETADHITISDGEMTSYSAHLDPPGYITGHVRGSWSVIGANPPIVRAYGAQHDVDTYQYVAESGEFALVFYVADNVRLAVDIEGIRRWIGGDDETSATLFAVASGVTISGVSFLESGIQCEVEGVAGEPFPSCAVTLLDDQGQRLIHDTHGRDESSSIPMPNLRPGAYFLKVEPVFDTQTWFPQWYDQKETLLGATPITISTAGEAIPITVHLIKGAVIQGRVLREDGSSVPDAAIYVGPAADSTQAVPATVDSDLADLGIFKITRLGTGDYKIGARLEFPGPIFWYPGTTVWDSAGTISVIQGEEIEGLELRIP